MDNATPNTLATDAAPPAKRSFTRALGSYSFVLIFLCILVAYLIINRAAITWGGVMNSLRHSTV
ncbi:MAG: hypothetical protein LBU67_02765, partial [Oscillospiraceae bacterium]|nr:hypothetical protein [Oscillospiraceae bacterium]